MIKYRKEKRDYMKIVCRILYMLLFVGIICPQSIHSYSLQIQEWDRLYKIVTEEKLPLLSNKEEEDILREVDKLIKEDRSVYLATLYLSKKVGDYEKGYIIYGNSRIKEKLVEIMKMRIQCGLKRSIIKMRESIQEEIENKGEKRQIEDEFFLNIEKGIRLLENRFEKLVRKDGDLCTECYIFDEEEEIARKNRGKDEEFGGYSWSVSVFYSIALSTFPKDIYDYLWVYVIPKVYFHTPGKYIDVDESIFYLNQIEAFKFNFAKVYAKQLIDELKKGKIVEDGIYVNEWERMSCYMICNIVKTMFNINKEFLQEEKKYLKDIIFSTGMKRIEKLDVQHESILEKLLKEGKGIGQQEWADLTLLHTYEVEIREDILEIYEQIGEKEDIEDIKRLGEGINLDYPVRETNRVGDEEMKERYLQRVKDIQERIKTLVEKLSR